MKGVVRLKMGTWTYVPNCLAQKRKTLGVVSIVMTDPFFEFYAQTCTIGCFGAKLVGKGEVDVRHYKQSASDYIKENSLNITDTVETDNVYFYPVQNGSVDSNLSRDADGLEKTGAGTYVLLWNDCGTIANSWLKHAKEVLKQAEDSVPGGRPFDGPGF